MKTNSLKEYTPPVIKVYNIEMEACITATSVTKVNTVIEEEWEEEEIDLGKITW